MPGRAGGRWHGPPLGRLRAAIAGLRLGRLPPCLLVGLLVLTACGTGRAADSLTLATWNVENYVGEDRMVEGGYRTGYPKPEAAKAALRAAIREMAPDVLALQEMGPEPYLNELQRDLAAEGSPFAHRAWLDGPDPKRHLAVLSRVPLQSVHLHPKVWHHGTGEPLPVCRGVLEVVLAAPEGGAVSLFLVHLKSRHTSDPRDPASARQRAGEAEAVRDLVLKRFPDPATARFLIVGDCNDSPSSRPLRALLARGGRRIAVLMDSPDADGDLWTHCYRKHATYSRVDYILPSPALQRAVRRMWIHDSPAVRAASDHRPVLVRFARE